MSISTRSSWSRPGASAKTRCSQLLTQGPYPARDPAQNIADLKAQAAANAKGVDELGKMVAQYGLGVVQAYMGHVQDNAAASVARVIDELEPASFEVETDTGARIKVAIDIDRARGKAIVDFTGTSGQQPDTFNAPEPITRACVLYVFRTLVDDDIPLNAGCLRHIEIVVPEGSMLEPALSRRGRRRQCRDEPDHRELPLWRAWGARLGAGHHEQPHLRQSARAILRDDLLRRAGRPRLRRRGSGADAHDQFAADRPRGARASLSGSARALRDQARVWRQRQMARRRRDASRHSIPGAHGVRHPVRLPPHAALRDEWRRARRARREFRAAEGWAHGEPGGLRASDRSSPATPSSSRRRPAAASARRTNRKGAGLLPRPLTRCLSTTTLR